MKKFLLSGIAILMLMVVIAFTNSGSYSVINKSGVNVTGITITPSGDNSGNLSTTFSRTISKDQSIGIDFTVNEQVCEYDIRFTDESGKQYLMNGVNLCNSSEIILVTNKADEVPQIYVPNSK